MKWLVDTWYRPHPLRWLLLPPSWLYRMVTGLRRLAYRRGWLKRCRPAVPVIVVGNISVGGTGKTPFVIWLLDVLGQAGFRPGVVSRGYGGKARHYPMTVSHDSAAAEAGDEPVLIACRSACPVVVAPDRCRAARQLLAQHDCDVIVSDDGLQHYALQRDIEIAIIDAGRRFGNKLCLPAGPLREPMSRLSHVDFIIYHGEDAGDHFQMQLEADALVNLADNGRRLPLYALREQEVHAVAGIGHPQRFFDQLSRAGLIVHPHPFADHHQFSAADLDFGDTLPVLMTEKDAVKCRQLAADNWWYLPVTARLTESLSQAILTQLEEHR